MNVEPNWNRSKLGHKQQQKLYTRLTLPISHYSIHVQHLQSSSLVTGPSQNRLQSTICYNFFSDSSPVYLSNLTVYTPSKQLRSTADTWIFCIPHVRTETSGQRSFSYLSLTFLLLCPRIMEFCLFSFCPPHPPPYSPSSLSFTPCYIPAVCPSVYVCVCVWGGGGAGGGDLRNKIIIMFMNIFFLRFSIYIFYWSCRAHGMLALSARYHAIKMTTIVII